MPRRASSRRVHLLTRDRRGDEDDEPRIDDDQHRRIEQPRRARMRDEAASSVRMFELLARVVTIDSE